MESVLTLSYVLDMLHVIAHRTYLIHICLELSSYYDSIIRSDQTMQTSKKVTFKMNKENK